MSIGVGDSSTGLVLEVGYVDIRIGLLAIILGLGGAELRFLEGSNIILVDPPSGSLPQELIGVSLELKVVHYLSEVVHLLVVVFLFEVEAWHLTVFGVPTTTPGNRILNIFSLNEVVLAHHLLSRVRYRGRDKIQTVEVSGRSKRGLQRHVIPLAVGRGSS